MVEVLRERLYLAEAATFSNGGTRLGERFISSVERRITATYERVELPPQVFTLASQTGTLPVRITNESSYSMRVLVRLVADRRLEFPRGSARTVVLQPRSQTIDFDVRAQSTGRIPVKVQVQTSRAAPLPDIAETRMVVRSTAYNRVALFLTVGAALFLMLWWGRRFLPRGRN